MPIPPQGRKKLWEMTRDEYRLRMMRRRAQSDIPSVSSAARNAIAGFRNPATKPLVVTAWREIFQDFDSEHSRLVEQAIRDEKPVPAKVLVDFPDLKQG